MGGDGKERRRYERVFFARDEAIVGSISFLNRETAPIAAGVLNLSECGICIFFKRKLSGKVIKGDRMILHSIKGFSPELSLQDVQMEVRWIMDHKAFENLELGCEMLDVTEEQRSAIREIVASRR